MRELLLLAERQYGVFTHAQALACGLSDRQVERRVTSGSFGRVYAGVYRIPGSYRSARRRAMALVLWCGDEALLSHHSAASLLRIPASDDVWHISADRRVQRSLPDLRLHRPTNLIQRDRTQVDGLPCTSGTRTIIDLATVLDHEEFEHAFDTARRYGLTTIGALERRAAELARVPKGVQHVLRVASTRPTESRLEAKAARLLREHGLFPPTTQFRVGCYRIDFAWPDLALALEPDGFEWHGSRLAWKRDRRRIAYLEDAGWRLVHWTWEDVTARPGQAIARLRRALCCLP
jgi:very-short-patch-repair endonuclease